MAGPGASPRSSAVALTRLLTLYAGYTQGLEESGVAPSVARNSGAVLHVGGRYAFTVLGKSSTLRVQVRNALNFNSWQTANTPGDVSFAGPRTVFAYVTTDF